MFTAKEISRQLALRVEEIAVFLLPNGKKHHHEWCVGSIHGEIGSSLKIHLSGEKAGIWCDFATGDKGDLLDLWAKSRHLTLSETMKEAASYMGIRAPKFEEFKTPNFSKPNISKAISPNAEILSYLIEKRRLLKETIEAYKIKEVEQQIFFPYIRDNEVVFGKYLKLKREYDKKIMRVDPNCEPCLFGWHVLANYSRFVIICEGEIDAMTFYQYGFPALSVPFGAGGGKKHDWITYEFERLSIFDEILLCMDDDQEGHIATSELVDRLGRHRCRIIKLPCKDINECLQNSVPKNVIEECINKAKNLDPEELKSAKEFTEQVVDAFYPTPGTFIGYTAPWNKINEQIFFRFDEISVWTGINGHGKSQFLGQIILHSMKKGARVCIASLEIKPKRLLMRLTKQAGALAEPSKDYIRAIHEWFYDKLWLFDLVGTAKAQRLLDVFLYAHQRYGVDIFVIDSLMKLDIAEDDYKAQKAFMEQLCDFKNQHNCHIHIVIHPRKGANEDTPPGKLDNKGTGALTDLADNCFTIWRNKGKEKLKQALYGKKDLTDAETKKLEEADCLWRCDKQRNGEWEGTFRFWFHQQSLQYLEYQNQKPIRYVEYFKNHTNPLI